ncbi:MAG: hypothetical protein AVDCRST_MAG13-1443 [uncultured Solirubrobacteraceae bacterium]|uniref:Activator of Hsp90 ATPase homologue 1/2-like C-terminal domain-containing protein n=1 Tax=uncultured Solirubrobacteraceae bacterium TaxID=1162706 RepID=A0A6J4RZX5_9ACTN|nr:MAG: hypothetical protein AVDCRST_MAG13-1443 [uncultured Solirubrobacteraceae bacterium]
MSAHGTYTTVDGRPAVVFERRLHHPVDAVWPALTEPARLGQWFPCDVEVDLRPGGAMRFTFPDGSAVGGRVVELDPPRRLAFLWGEDLLTFALAPEGSGSRLTLTHVLEEEGRDAAAKTAAGWHVCLDDLHRALDGGTPGRPHDGPTPEWSAHYDAYVAAGLPAGAPVPGMG